MSLRVVRKVEDLEPATVEYLTAREQFDPAFPWLDNDAVRDADFTDEIIAKTVGYGIANEDGEVLREVPGLQVAERAVAGARIVFDVDIPDDPAEG